MISFLKIAILATLFPAQISPFQLHPTNPFNPASTYLLSNKFLSSNPQFQLQQGLHFVWWLIILGFSFSLNNGLIWK